MSLGFSALRIGQGYDVHKLVEGRKLIIGGVDIPATHQAVSGYLTLTAGACRGRCPCLGAIRGARHRKSSPTPTPNGRGPIP